MRIYQAITFLEDTFRKLQKEFSLTDDMLSLHIVTNDEFVRTLYETTYKDWDITKDQLIDLLVTDLDGQRRHFMRVLNSGTSEDGIKHQLFILKEFLHLIVYSTQATDEEFCKLSELCLRHEIGHVLHTFEVFNTMGIDKGSAYLCRLEKLHRLAFLKCIQKLDDIDDISDDEYNYELRKNYYSHKIEAEANRIAKVNTKELLKLETSVFRDIDFI